MLIFGLALLAGGIGVLVGFRDELGVRPPDPRRWLAYGTAGAMGLAALLWHPVPRTRRRTGTRPGSDRPGSDRPASGRVASGRVAVGRAAVPVGGRATRPASRTGLRRTERRPGRRVEVPRTEVIRDPVTRLPSRPRAVGRAAVPPPGTASR